MKHINSFFAAIQIQNPLKDLIHVFIKSRTLLCEFDKQIFCSHQIEEK